MEPPWTTPAVSLTILLLTAFPSAATPAIAEETKEPAPAVEQLLIQTESGRPVRRQMHIYRPEGSDLPVDGSPAARCPYSPSFREGSVRTILYCGSEASIFVAPGLPTLIIFPPGTKILGGFKKPVLYLYPPTATEVRVSLKFAGSITASYPTYDAAIMGWQVRAEPDGTLRSLDGRKEYDYLFWEGESDVSLDYDPNRGFTVASFELVPFFEDALTKLGLSPREINDFIVYWYPVLKKNRYTHVFFASDAYERAAALTTVPAADTVIRVFAVFRGLEEPTTPAPQVLTAPPRRGFTVVEWGGLELDSVDPD